MNYKKLPIYRSRKEILKAIAENQITIIESTTGSGKTTVLPLLLYEAGYTQGGMIGITQPRRIATLSVSEFIGQIVNKEPDFVGYKMRFDDTTTPATKIKIMTDGSLLQEMKSDPYLSKYSIIMVDEAHERSLNIDFLLGILKKILTERKDFKVIISSATLNTQAFSEYFFSAPVLRIDTPLYPVQVIYDPPKDKEMDSYLEKIEEIIVHGVESRSMKDALIFLPGEAYINGVYHLLMKNPLLQRKCLFLRLYGRLSRQEQARVFLPTPRGKSKIILSTNIAETSVTIDGVEIVIDSGLSKLNYHNPLTFTSALEEVHISKASAAQRKGRAGRTRPGICYRLYAREEFDKKDNYTKEEIYRTDLAEVVLRMAELNLNDFENFDFINRPGVKAIRGAVQTLESLDALKPDRQLSQVGQFMAQLPLSPRHSRIIWEGILKYPNVLSEILIVVSFLSTHSPYLIPSGKLHDARKRHQSFSSPWGDFLSYLNLFNAFTQSNDPEHFCRKNFLDLRIMYELVHINEQLRDILSQKEIPILGGGDVEDILKACAKGLVQFICEHEKRYTYRSQTTERIIIHPGSVLFKKNPAPKLVVAGEIIRTSQMFARSVSVLKPEWLKEIDPQFESPQKMKGKKKKRENSSLLPFNPTEQKRGDRPTKNSKNPTAPREIDSLQIGDFSFPVFSGKKKIVSFEYEKIQKCLSLFTHIDFIPAFPSQRGEVLFKGKRLMKGAKVNSILHYLYFTNRSPLLSSELPKKNFHLYEPSHRESLFKNLDKVLLIDWEKSGERSSFVTLNSDEKETFWFSLQSDLQLAVNESTLSLNTLFDRTEKSLTPKEEEKSSSLYEYLENLFLF